MTVSLSATLRRAMGRGFLRGLIGLMTFLAFSAAILALACQSFASRWQADVRHTLTLEITGAQSADDAALNDFLSRLRGLPGVASAGLESASRVRDMLAPWFGSDTGVIERLPLPRLVELELKKDDAASRGSLQETADAFAKSRGWSVNIIAHRAWLAGIVRFAAMLTAVGWGICLMIVATTGMAVAMAVRAQIVAHADDIEILEILGASDRYTLRQFMEATLFLAAQGIGIGVAAALVLWGGLAALLPDAARIAQGESLLPGLATLAFSVPALLVIAIAAATAHAVRHALTGGPDKKDMWA